MNGVVNFGVSSRIGIMRERCRQSLERNIPCSDSRAPTRGAISSSSMDAVLVIDKPKGITSHDVVALVRRLLGERSVGHLGTLDPLATGVLPLLIGRYTRLAQFFGSSDKSYEGVIRLGFATTTYDADGDPVGPVADGVKVTLEELRRAARTFVGDIRQTPPQFSAKKIAGVPAYRLARKKQDIEL